MAILKSKNMDKDIISTSNICVVGLGYVGLPLFCLLSSKYKCYGYDNDNNRIRTLVKGYDSKCCISHKTISNTVSRSMVTSNWEDVAHCNIYIITVPTPIDHNNKPDVSALRDVCINISHLLKKDDIVIFESTVYPGATEELCVSILETHSNLRLGEFKVGYSPERINVGDDIHQLHNTPKIVSASDKNTLDVLYTLYSSIIDKSVVKATSIKIAEAAKMYENVQRDVLIGLANEYSNFCRAIGIDIHEVTKCSSSKWNFSAVYPGLVGGHCIGVDPYYLIQKASDIGIPLPLISQARITNEEKSSQVARRFVEQVLTLEVTEPEQKVLILGVSYKKNCADIRNTKVVNLVREIEKYGYLVDVYDPLVDKVAVEELYNIHLIAKSEFCLANYRAILEVVHHDIFNDLHVGSNSSSILTIEQFL